MGIGVGPTAKQPGLSVGMSCPSSHANWSHNAGMCRKENGDGESMCKCMSVLSLKLPSNPTSLCIKGMAKKKCHAGENQHVKQCPCLQKVCILSQGVGRQQ